MDAIDQAPAERALHRVVHIVAFVRTMTLYGVFALAVAGTALLGWIPMPPMLSDAQASASTVDWRDPEASPAALVAAVVVVLGLVGGLMVWMYLAIVRRWRRSLALLALVFAIVGVIVPLDAARLLPLHDRLHGLFVALALAEWLLLSWYSLDVATALWRISRPRQLPGFVEALDVGLARGPWQRLNRFLGLPRAPWRGGGAAIWLLSLLGLLLTSVSVAYLFLGGGVAARLDVYTAQCLPEAAALDCRTSSRHWAWWALAGFAACVAGIKLGAGLQAWARKLVVLRPADVLPGPGAPFVLYLRPFPVDRVRLPRPALPALSALFSFRALPVLLEEELFDVCDGWCPLIAVGDPNVAPDARSALAYRDYPGQHWAAYVEQKVRDAVAVVLVLSTTPGVVWEMHHVIERGALDRTLFLFEPAARDPARWDALASVILPALHATGRLPPGWRFDGRPIGFHFAGSTLVQIVNEGWSTTSYRIAFACFLRTRANGLP